MISFDAASAHAEIVRLRDDLAYLFATYDLECDSCEDMQAVEVLPDPGRVGGRTILCKGCADTLREARGGEAQ